MSERYTPQQRAQRAVNLWFDHMGYVGEQDLTTDEREALQRFVENELLAVERDLALARRVIRAQDELLLQYAGNIPLLLTEDECEARRQAREEVQGG